MKTLKRMKIAFFAVLGICAIACIGRRDVSAKGINTLSFQADETKKTYKKYDITNDGKTDKLVLEKSGYDAGMNWYEEFKIYVNGRTALRINADSGLEGFSASPDIVQVLTLSNNKSYLFLHFLCSSAYEPSWIYEYKGNSFYKRVDFQLEEQTVYAGMEKIGIRAGAVVNRVSGNKILVSMGMRSTFMGGMTYEAVYRYKNGKLVLQSHIHKITESSAHEGNALLTVKKKLQLYNSKTLKKKKAVLPAGTKLTVKKCYISGKKVSFYLEENNGKGGWFKLPASLKSPFKEAFYF